MQSLEQTGHKDPDSSTFQPSRPYVKPELPGTIPANNAAEKPELVGSHVWDEALPPTWQHTSLLREMSSSLVFETPRSLNMYPDLLNFAGRCHLRSLFISRDLLSNQSRVL